MNPGAFFLGREKSSGLGALGDDGQDLLEQCLDYKARSCGELQAMIVMGRLGRSNDPEAKETFDIRRFENILIVKATHHSYFHHF